MYIALEVKLQIGTNYLDVETYTNKLENTYQFIAYEYKISEWAGYGNFFIPRCERISNFDFAFSLK